MRTIAGESQFGTAGKTDVECVDTKELRTRAMTRDDLPRYKQLLLAKLDELSARPANATFRTPGAGGQMGDLADQANADSEAALHIQLHRSDAHLLRAIEDALARIRQGRYGECEVCKLPISKPRLEAVPWTRLCRDCKDQERT